MKNIKNFTATLKQCNKNLLYSALFTVATQLVYNSVYNFTPIIGTQAAMLFTFITGAMIQRNNDDEWYKKLLQKHTTLPALVNGGYAVCWAALLVQTDNDVLKGVGIAAEIIMHPSITKVVEKKIQDIGYCMAHVFR